MELWPASVRDASPLELIETAAVQWLRTDPRMTALVGGRIYTAIPPGTPFPMVLVGSTTDEPFSRFRHAGVNATLILRASSQVRGTYEVHRIADQMRMVIENQRGPLPPFRTMQWTFDSGPAAFSEDLAGTLTFHRPIVLRVRLTIA